MMIVTGGAGMVGSNIVSALNARGITDILVVDHLVNGRKMHNLADLDIADYVDREDFLHKIVAGYDFGHVEAVFHQGACSSTTEWDGRFIMRNNFEFSKTLLHWAQTRGAQFLYASSASVYGRGEHQFSERRSCEHPISMYAYSKFLFDQYVRQQLPQVQHQVAGFRYFNVYGPREAHKGTMSSMVFHFNQQILQHGVARLFMGTDGYADGEQRRDFVYVADCVAVNLWFLDHPEQSGIFNLGTGQARSFNELAQTVIAWHKTHTGLSASIEYIPFPEHLRGVYQNHTVADTRLLQNVGYNTGFHSIEEGTALYLAWLNQEK